MKMSIRMKLTLGFATTILMLVVLLLTIQSKTKTASTAINEVIDESVPAVELCLSIQGEIHHALSMHRGYMILGLESLAQERLDTWKNIDSKMLELDEIAADWTDQSTIDDYAEFKTVMGKFRIAQQRIADVCQTKNDLPANIQYFEIAEPFGDEMMNHLQAILDEEESLPADAERKLLVRRIGEAEGHLLKSRNAISAYLGSGQKNHRDRITSSLNACTESVKRLRTMTDLFTPTQQEHFENYIASRTAFIEEANKAVAIRNSPEFSVSENICLNVVTPLANTAVELMGNIAENQAQVKEESIAHYEGANASMLSSMWIVGIMAVASSITVAFFLSGSITRRLGILTNYATQIAERNLGMPDLDMKATDEIGQLAHTVNTMKNAIKQVISDVINSTQTVASASTQIAASAEQMSAGLQTQEQQTQQVAAAIEELSQSVNEVAAKSSDATDASVESQTLAEDGGNIVSETVSEMKGIATEVQSSADTINKLGEKSETIGEIIAVINDIADQTNLLALNAAIEAARAGEHGRGFAVVADEVRKLAERTTEATEEVSQSIRGIQSETKVAVELIESGSQRVGRGVDLATSAGTSLGSIVSGSQGVQQMVQDIAAAAQEQSSATQEIARAVEGISEVTRQSSEGASQSSQTSSELAQQAEQLQSLVAQFKLD